MSKQKAAEKWWDENSGVVAAILVIGGLGYAAFCIGLGIIFGAGVGWISLSLPILALSFFIALGLIKETKESKANTKEEENAAQSKS